MKKSNLICGIALLFCLSIAVHAEVPLGSFLSKYQDPIYQDIVIGNHIHEIGTDLCAPRYELIKPLLDRYTKSFTLLDLGAAQGYFSFRTATDYPHSSCVMIESNNTSYYAHHGDMLYDLCRMNSHLENISYINKRINLTDLQLLNKDKHFDIVLALLVVHLMDESLHEQIKIIEELLQLGDYLIIEVANDVGVVHTAYVEYLCDALKGQYLGEVKRHKDICSTSTGKLFLFHSHSVSS